MTIDPRTPPSILVVDDTVENLQVLTRILKQRGYRIRPATSGRIALESARSEPPDLVLLDITMPGMNGYEVCAQLKADERLRDIPVIFISALSETGDKIKAFEAGGVDFVTKPFQIEEVQARVSTHLRLYELQRSLTFEVGERRKAELRALAYADQFRKEEEKTQSLLQNMLPSPIAARLRAGEKPIADDFPEASVLFADIVEFTRWAAETPAVRVVEVLNDLFSAFDRLAERHGVEKVKTIGDAYMAVAGVPVRRADHALAAASLGLDMLREVAFFREHKGCPLEVRIGINSGPVVAGVIGSKKLSYDLWGDTVNVASRMAASGLPGVIQLTDSTRSLLPEPLRFVERAEVEVKGKGKCRTYLLGSPG